MDCNNTENIVDYNLKRSQKQELQLQQHQLSNNNLNNLKNLPINLNSSDLLINQQKMNNNNNNNEEKNVHIIRLSDMININNNIELENDNENYDKSVSDNDNNNSDIITEYIGHIGKWQIGWSIILCLFQIPSTFHIFAFVFQAAEKEFWCARPNNMMDMDINIWRNMTQPKGSCSILNISLFEIISNNLGTYLKNNDKTINNNLTNCNKFEYDQNVMGDTVISEWNLVCDRANLISVVEMCYLAGAAVGSICSGWISDKYGRRHSLMIFATIQSFIGAILAFSNSLPMFMLLRTIIGFASMSVVNISFVLVVELVSGKWRTIIGILNILPVAISYMLMALIAYFIRDWRTTQLVISVPGFFLLLIWCFLPESPRWLLANGRVNELIDIIKIAANRNEIVLSLEYEKRLIGASQQCEKNNNNNVSFLNLFHTEYRRTTILMIITWYSLILVYFGITLHLNNLGGNIYVNTAIAGAVESVAILLCIFVVLKAGIKINLVVYMLIAGIVCLMVNLISDANILGIISLAMIGKCTIGATNALIPTFTAIQYPTTMRTLAIGVGNFAAGVALITVPYLWLLEHVQTFLPMTIMGIFGVIGAIALVLMNDKKLIIKNAKNKCLKSSIPNKSKGLHNSAYVEN